MLKGITQYSKKRRFLSRQGTSKQAGAEINEYSPAWNLLSLLFYLYSFKLTS